MARNKETKPEVIVDVHKLDFDIAVNCDKMVCLTNYVPKEPLKVFIKKVGA